MKRQLSLDCAATNVYSISEATARARRNQFIYDDSDSSCTFSFVRRSLGGASGAILFSVVRSIFIASFTICKLGASSSVGDSRERARERFCGLLGRRAKGGLILDKNSASAETRQRQCV